MKNTLKNTFFPRKENNHKPHFWHPISVGFFAIILVALSGIILFKTTDIDEQSLLGDIKSGVVIALTNTERQDIGVPELVENEILNQAALLKAQDMATNSYFAHYSPQGFSPWHWFNQTGYSYEKAGENLAVNFNDSKKVVNAWMNSPTHKANIIKDGYTEIGIGIADGIYKGKSATFVVQLFGLPKTTQPTLFSFNLEKGTDFALDDTTTVKGISSETISLKNILNGDTSSVYVYLAILALLTFVILGAILLLVLKDKKHRVQFFVSLIVLIVSLVIALSVQIDVWQNISISF